MSYDPRLLFAQICVRLDETPARSLLDLSREFQIDTPAIQNVISSMTGGAKFSTFKDDILIARLTRLFLAKPSSPINELSLELGYKSDEAFTRAVRRASGVSPVVFRNRILGEARTQKAHRLKAATTIN